MIKENVGWHAADNFYNLVMELQQDMLDMRKSRNVWGMLDTLDDIYIHVLPYVEKHMSDKEKEMFRQHDDIIERISTVKDNPTDFAALNNNQTMTESVKLINDKRKVLSRLMARAGLNLPLNSLDNRPAALDQDD